MNLGTKISRKEFLKFLALTAGIASLSIPLSILFRIESIRKAYASFSYYGDDGDRPLREFEVGINIAALDNEYGHDLGYNQFSGRQFWDDSWQIYDFTKPDPNASELSPWIHWEDDNLKKTISKYNGVVDIIRIWVFEQHEGLRFSYDNNLSSYVVSGIDSTQLIPNIIRVLDMAHNYDIKVYLCLIDGWIGNNRHVHLGYEEEKLEKHTVFQNTRRLIMKNIIENPQFFIANALVPFIDSIKGHPALYAIDIMNEPEAISNNSLNLLVTEQKMHDFLIKCSDAIKSASSNTILVSTGLLMYESIKRYNLSMPENAFDFYDHHLYSSNTERIQEILSAYKIGQHGNKRLVLGEVGYPKDFGDDNDNDIAEEEMEIVKEIFENAYTHGHSPCLLWSLDFYEKENRKDLLKLLRNYKNKKRKRSTKI